MSSSLEDIFNIELAVGARWCVISRRVIWLMNLSFSQTNSELQGWRHVVPPSKKDFRWGMKDIEIDSFLNVVISLYTTIELDQSSPLRDVIHKAIHSNEFRERIEHCQLKLFKDEGFWRPCPHSIQIRFPDYGVSGHRKLLIQDLLECVPPEWPADFVVDQQRDELIVVWNHCGDLFTCPPGATMNIGVTAWLYDPNSGQVLTLTKSRHGKSCTVKPGGNLDIAADTIALDHHPYYANIPDSTRIKLRERYLDWEFSAFRELVEEIGLYDSQVQFELGSDVMNRILNSEPKLMQIEDWIGNPIAPSMNLHVVYSVPGLATDLDISCLKLSKEEGIVSAQFESVTNEEKYAIEHAMTIHNLSNVKSSNLTTRSILKIN